MPSGRVEMIGLAAGVHDIGKLAVPDSILLKPSPPTEEEWAVLRSHTTIGGLILSGHGEPLLDLAASVARSHHEAFDGRGYPDGLRGEAIPREARIVAVCDVYDALRQTRPYKRGLGHAVAMDLLREGDARLSPSIFDPMILSAFLGMAPRVERAWEERAP
jgi:putative two-component system response regulator